LLRKKIKFLILGAGPSGLAVAHALIDRGCRPDDVLVVEKNKTVGGLCRSENIDGAPIDIGGGHFLDVRRKDVLEFLFHFLPREEWNLFSRISTIRLRGTDIDYPLEANLWQLPTNVQADFLESIARAGCVCGETMPQTFAEWIKWKLGESIAQEYMLPYNRKIWSMDLDQLGTYWLEKLPSVSFRETLLSCLEKKPMGVLPAHGTFLYPKKFGYGEVWRRMGEALDASLITNFSIEHIDLETHIVNGRWQAQTIISTIPWPLWTEFCDLPQTVLDAISCLKNAPIDVDYYPDIQNSSAHWIYEPDESIPHHRLLLRGNFVTGAQGYWTEANANRSQKKNTARFHNSFAYPINTLNKPEAVDKILNWARNNNIYGLGRWGKWEHVNSDLAVAEAIRMAESFNIWIY
jgi:protoporphyrinogen oxidase